MRKTILVLILLCVTLTFLSIVGCGGKAEPQIQQPPITEERADEPPQWPREILAEDGAKLVIYQPQIDSWTSYLNVSST